MINCIRSNQSHIDNLNCFIYNTTISLNEIHTLQKLMLNKSLIIFFDELISHLYIQLSFPKLNSKHFILAWLIIAFPSTILGISQEIIFTNPNLYSSFVYNTTKQMLDAFNVIYKQIIVNNEYQELDMKKFCEYYGEYVKVIIEFMCKDKKQNRELLINEYKSINLVIEKIKTSKKYNEDEKKQSIIQLNKSKLSIITTLKKIDSSFIPDE